MVLAFLARFAFAIVSRSTTSAAVEAAKDTPRSTREGQLRTRFVVELPQSVPVSWLQKTVQSATLYNSVFFSSTDNEYEI